MLERKNYKKVLLSIVLVFGAWTIVALVFALKQYVWVKQNAPEKTFFLAGNFVLQFVSCIGWMLWTPMIWWAVNRFLPEGKRFYSNVFLLILTGVSVILLQAIYQAITLPFLGYKSREMFTSFSETFEAMLFTNFFFSLALFIMTLGFTLMYAYYKKFKERELLNSRLETNLTQARLQTLKMQLHPHFLFNTHNAISELVYSDPATADKMITNLSDLLRISLENMEIEEVTLQQEMSFVTKYIEIEQIRFQERLKFDVELAPTTLDAVVPSMILQPIIENAVRHGITPLAEGGTIVVRSKIKRGNLQLDVIDDGAGFDVPNQIVKGIGLTNTEERLRHIYKDQQRIRIDSAAGEGFSISIEIPHKVTAKCKAVSGFLKPEVAG